jgi:secreted trypsin-like serine protease
MKKTVVLGAVFATLLTSLFANATPANAIVGGNDTFHQYGAASLWYPDNQGVNRHRCTASVIDRYWAITAGHCQVILYPGQTQVRTSSVDNTTGENVGLAAFYVHPGFVSGGSTAPNQNDIALIKFQRPIDEQKTQPLTLLTGSQPVGTQGKTASWGYICDDIVSPINCGLPHTKILQELGLTIVSDSTCSFFSTQPDPLQLCLMSNNIDKNPCNGDSGAPLVRKGLNEWLLMGMITGDGDRYFPTQANPNTPNYCTCDENGNQGKSRAVDTTQYVDWIFDTIIANTAGVPTYQKN